MLCIICSSITHMQPMVLVYLPTKLVVNIFQAKKLGVHIPAPVGLHFWV